MILPENILRCVNAKDRASLGKAGMTPEEAMEAYSARSEKELQKQISNLLNLRNIVYINPPMHKRSILPPGWPDYTLAIGSVAIAIEVKIGNKEASDEQKEMHAKMRRNGWQVHVVRTLREVQDLLQPNP